MQSIVTTERPDPLIQLADNDMNTFTSVHFSWDYFQRDFKSGWRIYRATPVVSKEQMTLELSAVRAVSMEVYVDGKQIFVNTEDVEGCVKCPFTTKSGEKVDIRILIQGKESVESGIKECIRLYGGKRDV